MHLQGRTAFGQAPPAEPSQGRENDRRKSAAATGSAGDREIVGGVAQGVEGRGGLSELIVPTLRVGIQPLTLRVTGRRASLEAFPRRAWEQSRRRYC